MKISNKRIWLRTLTALAMLLIYTCQPILCNATEVWSDNFDDLDCDDWTVSGGAFSCENGYLETTDIPSPSTGSLIYHESNIQHGTWSFDVYLLGTEWYLLIMVDDWEFHTRMLYVEVRNTRIGIGRVSGIIASWVSPDVLEGTWTHIDVTVDEEWTINVFVNDIHRINYDTLSMSSTNYLLFNPFTVGQALDNIVIDDTIDYESLLFNESYIPTTTTTTQPETTTTTTTTITTTTTTGPSPVDGGIDTSMILLIGGGVAAIVVVLLIVWKVKGT